MHKRFLLLLSAVLALAVAATAATPTQVTLSGKVTQWKNGKESPLSGATVIVGKDIFLDASGQVDVVKNAKGIVAEVKTDDRGAYTAKVPAGTYTVILWRARYTPSSHGKVKAPGQFNGSISADNQVGSAGRHASLSRKS